MLGFAVGAGDSEGVTVGLGVGVGAAVGAGAGVGVGTGGVVAARGTAMPNEFTMVSRKRKNSSTP